MSNRSSKRPRLFLVALLLLTLLTGRVSSQIKFDPTAWENTVLQELKSNSIPGAVIGIVNGDQIVYTKAFGIANVETGEPVTADMLFRIGSMTKMFTATALLRLVEEGQIKLDQPVGRYIQGLNAKVSNITAHQLLSHTSGIKEEARPFGAHDEAALGAAVRSWTDDYVFTEPGKIFSYSNANFALAGLMIQETGKKPFADLLNDKVFGPLGMKRTTFRPTVAMTYSLAQGHQARGGSPPVVVRPFADNVADWPAGFMFSNITDLARFAIAFMNDGRIGGKQVLEPSLIAKLVTPYAEIPGTDIKYGYGLRIESYRGVRTVQHGGAIAGFGSQLIMVPDHRFAVIVLCNSSGARIEKTVEKIMEALAPLTPRPASQPPKILTTSEADVKNFVGTYSNSARNSFEVVSLNGGLALKDEDGSMPLRKIDTYHFLMESPGSPEPEDVVFVTSTGQEAQYLHINGRAFRKITVLK